LWENDKVARSPAPEGLTKSSEKRSGDSRSPPVVYLLGAGHREFTVASTTQEGRKVEI